MLKKMFAVFSLFVVMMPLVAFAEGTPSSAGVVAGIESSELLADALVEGASVQVATLSQDEMQAVEAGRRWRTPKWVKQTLQVLGVVFIAIVGYHNTIGVTAQCVQC